MQFYFNGLPITFNEFNQKVEQAVLLIDSLELPIEVHVDAQQSFYIASNRQKIEIKIQSALDYHKKFFYKNSIYNQPLLKALGLKKGISKPHVFDCTAGTLKDSLLIYSVFEKISCCERNKLVQFLIATNLEKANLQNFEFYQGPCNEFDLSSFDTIYYDPMYQVKNNKALPRKEMQFFRELIGSDEDILENINYLKSLNKRLVIKRSQKSPELFKPSLSFGEKSTIYDVYLP